MSISKIKLKLLGFLAGLTVAGFKKDSPASKHERLKKIEFKTSAQRMGITMTDRIRRVFRYRWLKKL